MRSKIAVFKTHLENRKGKCEPCNKNKPSPYYISKLPNTATMHSILQTQLYKQIHPIFNGIHIMQIPIC